MRRASAAVVRVIMLLATLLIMELASAEDSNAVTAQHEVRALVEAARRYREVLQQDPADALAHYNLANVLLAAENPGSWQLSAWHFRRFMFYVDHGARYDKAEAALSGLESNLAALHVNNARNA